MGNGEMKKQPVRQLIKIKRDLRETCGPAKHDSPPISRRDFVGRGLLAGTSTLMLPSIFDMLTIRKAYGATPCDSLTLPPGLRNVSALVVDAVGGAAFGSAGREPTPKLEEGAGLRCSEVGVPVRFCPGVGGGASTRACAGPGW